MLSMAVRCVANIVSIRHLCSPMVFGRAMIVTSSTRKYAKMNFISWRVAEESHLAVENLCYKANLSGNSANSADRNVPQQNVEELISIIDNYIIDIKDMNNNIYQRYTGKNNENVLGNLRYLIGKDKAKQIVIRTPLIPSYNTEKDIDQSIELLKEMGITQFDRFTYKTPND